MSAKTFVDTNVLLYAHDLDAGDKHRVAKALLEDLWANRAGVLSTQVLQEFYVNVTRKIAQPLAKVTAQAIVEAYAVWCVDLTCADISAAFRIGNQARISFWDALICAAAIKSGAERLVSEDLNPGQNIAGIRVVNPFVGDSMLP